MRYLYYYLAPYLTPPVLLAILGVILLIGILWIALPFSVFGIKPLLRSIRDELRTMNASTAESIAQQRELIEQQKVLIARFGGASHTRLDGNTEA
ncbi:MAG: hypothetical protein WBV61_00530 [Rhodanobacteraceae bacterium]